MVDGADTTTLSLVLCGIRDPDPAGHHGNTLGDIDTKLPMI